MTNVFPVIFRNVFQYDLIIFLTAILTGIVFHQLKKCSTAIYQTMNVTIYVPDKELSRKEADRDMGTIRETDLVRMRKKMGKWYSLFVNLIGIFPLLGILGTVTSLLGIVEDSGNITGNFYSALTSTFWGLVFAIVFKIFDGMIYPEIEDNERDVELYLERNSGKRAENGESYEAKTEE